MNETPICKSSEKIRPEWVARYYNQSAPLAFNMDQDVAYVWNTAVYRAEWDAGACEILAFRDGFGPDGPLPVERKLADGWENVPFGQYNCTQLGCYMEHGSNALYLDRILDRGACEVHAESMGVFADPVPAKPKCEAPKWCGLPYGNKYVPVSTDWPTMAWHGRPDETNPAAFLSYCTQACLDGAKVEKSPSYGPIENRWCTNDDVHWAQCEYIGCAHLRSRTGGSAPGENTAPIPARPWNAPKPDDVWYEQSQSWEVDVPASCVDHSHVARLPDNFGTARSKLERENAQFRPRWR